ncbi:MAG: bifunctional phosphoribosyl-AMP cyclohydrolase/phosphoribosyl-ATP diphosphatase HisIE [Clostridia bacterium]|nr:bifunctional phosphoribosyl-AMP cyclohydrolase/phosphoribosyl-ATP diphosphatase HisIE [Clostridia bacterium]MDH7573670.1 bifunctional phosphoribosyl-AMP cyclohydrolase/phosphoribosyl-ATP diphosphatase HisIE [Clostridia bacterium]
MGVDLSVLKFDERGLIPAVIQDENGRVLMLAYMNREALEKTLAEGRTWFFSRSRGRLWLKGETSGHYQYVRSIAYDCDADALLVRVRQEGVACHEGRYSCFHNSLSREGKEPEGGHPNPLARALEELVAVIAERDEHRPEGAYTTYLFERGVDKIGKKVVEEAAETIIAAKNADREEVASEAADLLYHLLVLLRASGVSPSEVGEELLRRRR